MFLIKDDGKRDMPFDFLIVNINEYSYFLSKFKLMSIEVSMYSNMSRKVYTFDCPKKDKQDIVETLLKKYNGKWIKTSESIEIVDKKYKALEWLDSLALMWELYKEGAFK